jgi:tRNA acetyltransferase TAN1
MDEISDDSVDDIESSIQRELETLGNKGGQPHMFRAVRLDTPCLLFFKTELPVDPVEFVHRICQEIVTKPDIRKMRYINRLTPMSCVGKATEKGLEEMGKTVLRKHFQLSGEESRGEEKQSSCSVSATIFTQLPRISCSSDASASSQASVRYCTGFTLLGL